MHRYVSGLYILTLTLVALLVGFQALVLAHKQPVSLGGEPQVHDYSQIKIDNVIWLPVSVHEFNQSRAQLVAPESSSEFYSTVTSEYTPCSNSSPVFTAPPLGTPVETPVQAKASPAWLRLADWAFDSSTYENYNILIWSSYRNVDSYQLVPNWQGDEETVKDLAMSDQLAFKF